jgi:hypothetical protein
MSKEKGRDKNCGQKMKKKKKKKRLAVKIDYKLLMATCRN